MNSADVDRRFANAETAEFIDDVLEFFQENGCERAEEFEEWRKEKEGKRTK
jgi:hypothetical protein